MIKLTLFQVLYVASQRNKISTEKLGTQNQTMLVRISKRRTSGLKQGAFPVFDVWYGFSIVKSFYFRGEIKGAKPSQGSFFTFPNPSSFSLNSQTLFSSFPPPWKPVSERKRGRRVKLAVLCCLGLWHITDLLSRSLPQRLGDHMDLLRNMLGLMVRTASTFKLGLFCSSHLGKHWRNSPRF